MVEERLAVRLTNPTVPPLIADSFQGQFDHAQPMSLVNLMLASGLDGPSLAWPSMKTGLHFGTPTQQPSHSAPGGWHCLRAEP